MTNTNNIKCGSSSNGIVVTDLPLEVLRAMRDSINAAIQQQEALERARAKRTTDTSVREWLNRYLGMDEDDWDDEDEDYDEDYDEDDEDYDEDDEYDPCENCRRMTCRGCRIEE